MRFREAWEAALYGPDGFYRRERPAQHFRTSVHASALFGQALARLASAVGASQVVDIGAGSGELGKVLRECDLEVLDVELDDELPSTLTGLVIANEWLDNVPCELAELDDQGTPRYLLADLSLGEVVEGNDLAWLSTWWPLAEPGDRAEIGLARDEVWSDVVGRLDHGLAIAIDYGHARGGRPPYGTLTGFRNGRECSPVADGSCDLTAHVALDSLAAVAGGTVTSQRDALLALGVAAARPSQELARSEPLRYLAELSSAGEAAELLDSSGLGAFGWVWTGAGDDVVRRASRALSA
ncbi:SAM-dependent MidA family methyltransferase [Kribbella voronezhensis]|uniref:SAM-dependent MidA family methyltransferase n=1 Tax=Kribbella voronezhensis TaxID=2512212 RepID=A0A4R7TEH4_9ACTN|nr:SAM-dependent MidA family methyltransferase [Kribbella voronezhensis]